VTYLCHGGPPEGKSARVPFPSSAFDESPFAQLTAIKKAISTCAALGRVAVTHQRLYLNGHPFNEGDIMGLLWDGEEARPIYLVREPGEKATVKHTGTDQVMTVYLKDDDTWAELKRRLSVRMGLPVSDLILWHGGQLPAADDNQRIWPEKFKFLRFLDINLRVRQQPPRFAWTAPAARPAQEVKKTIPLCIKSEKGHELQLTAPLGSTVLELKYLIEDRLGIAPEKQSLSQGGGPFEDGTTLRNLGLQGHEVIYLED
jgi:hypothetical protein